MSDSANEIRARVSSAYARALSAAVAAPGPAETERVDPKASGCCATDCCGGDVVAEERDQVTVEVPSFGCGDPLVFAGVEPGQVVLDLGSGAGYDLLAAAEKVGVEGYVVGVDMTDSMIEAARRNAASAGYKNIEVRKGIIENLPVASESVDWVISNCVVNLSPEKERVFAEIARVLKPGGRFSISDITAEDLPREVVENEEAYDACIAGAIPETKYVEGLREAGLESVRVEARVPAHDLAEDCGCSTCDEGSELSGLEGKVWSVRITGRKPL